MCVRDLTVIVDERKTRRRHTPTRRFQNSIRQRLRYTPRRQVGDLFLIMASNLAVTSSSFEESVLKSDVPVLVDFWAEWCGPCKAIGPSIEQLAGEYAGKAKVFKLDVDTEGEIAQQYGVMSIPALLVFKGGKEIDRMVGAAPKATIAALIDRAL